jgi:hypothetical protein
MIEVDPTVALATNLSGAVVARPGNWTAPALSMRPGGIACAIACAIDRCWAHYAATESA